MGSGFSKLQKVGTPNRLASFTSGAPSTCLENTTSNHGEPPVRSDAATSVQTRRELELFVELEQARQQILQQEQKQKELSLELEQARQLINAHAHRRQPLVPTPSGELQSAENDDGVCMVRMAMVADHQGFLEAPDATLEEAAGQRMPEVENGMGTETQEGEEGVSSADGYCGGDDGMVAPSDVIVHGPGSVEDMLNVLEDIEKQLNSAALRSPQQTEGAHESKTNRQFKKKNEFEKLVQRMKAGNARVVLRKLFLYQKDSPPTVMQEIWIKDKSNPDAQGPKGDPYKEFAVVRVHHQAAIASQGGIGDVDETKHLDVVTAINVRHLAHEGHSYQTDNPFFNTYIERSEVTSLKMYPTDWTCKVCRQSNYPKKESCRGRGCKGTRPGAAWCWEWKKNNSFDEGLAEILGQADQAWRSSHQWQSGSGKSMHRVAGDKSGDGIVTLRLEELRHYAQSRKKACPLCCNIQCTCPDSSNAAKAAETSATPSEDSEQELPKVEVSQNKKPQHYLKEDGSPLDRPDDTPWPFTILFVGVDNGEKTDPDLNLKKEFEKIEQAYRESEVSKHGSSRVIIKRLLFSKWKEVMEEIIKEAPTMLHFGCHSHKEKGLELFGQIVDPHDMLEAIRSWNESARQQRPPRPEIRIIVLNACDSEDHACVLSEGVDFTIGHRAPVADEDAIDFSGIFYAGLFRCTSLMGSFNMAKSCSKGYRLFSPERDPRQFYLVHSRHLSATASDMRLSASGAATFSAREQPQDVSEGAGFAETSQYEIVAYLKGRGLGRITERLSEELSLEEIDDLQYVKEERLEKLKWLEDAPRAKVLKLCREVTARLMSADDSDPSADDTISQGASTPLAHSEGSYDGEGFESDGEGVLIAARNGGNCSDFQVHMQSFLKSWSWYLEADPAQETNVLDDPLWTRCMFLWIRFAHDATLDQRLRDKWLHATTNSPNQDRLLSILTECLLHSGTTHPRWSPAESCECRKQHAAGISFTDMVVHHALRRNEASKKDWRDKVVRGWFDNTDEPFSDFLIRANMFLSNPDHNINGMSIFEAVVETHSYVVFTKMSGLAASLLFGYLEARKLDLASAAGAAGGGRTLLHGFTRFVSSEGHAFSLSSRTGMDSLHDIVQGLQGMVHLAHTCWEMMGPVKTAQAFHLLQEDHTVELDTQEALFLSKQKDVPWEDGTHEGRVAEESRMKEVRKIYKNDVSHGVIRNYLEALRERWGHYIDSASGERRRVDCQAVSLLLVKGKSLHDVCDSGGSTRQEDLICPMSQSIMQDPVKCSDGHTDERKYIEEHFELALQKISIPEGGGGKTNPDVPFYTAEKFLEKFLKEIRLACLIGPPASGKSVTMQQVVCTHAATSFDNIHRQPQKDLALLPVFMRAAELPKLLSDNDKRVENMKDLVELFVSANIHEGTFDVSVKNLILELLDHGKVLICIDGIDEAAQHQDLVERIIDGAVKENRNLHILVSAREHSYRHSRGCLRLEAFDVVNLQPLDKDRQRAMIEDRLSKDKVGKFQEQLEAVAGKNPELATSPFLLSLIIEVYKEEGVIPTKRVELYDKQVKAIVSRCIYQRRPACIEREDKKGSLQILEKDLAVDADALEVSTDYLGTLAFVCQMRLAKRDFTLAASLRYEQELWQDMLHIEQQHFNALAKINPRLRGRQELLTLLHHTPDLLTRARELMFGNPIVGLLTVVGDKVYRFSHFTLQEYLAARCTVRFFGHDAQELLKKLTTFTDSASPQPLNSLWNRMALQFAACMLSEQVFEGFCQLVLASDDGTGSHCELVQDFLKERGASEKVEQMVCDRLQEIRDSERLILGLCHPSPELRSLMLSEMKMFGMPRYPFAETNGIAAVLKQIAQDASNKWHKRAAAVLSLVQIAQMDHCRQSENRTKTLRWLLELLVQDRSQGIARAGSIIPCALVKGLGRRLKAFEEHVKPTGDEWTRVDMEQVVLLDDEADVLYALNELRSALSEATKLVKELASEFKHLTGNSQFNQTKTLADDDVVHLVRLAIVADPEGFFERAVANNEDQTISRENFEKIFALECKVNEGEISESAQRLFDQLDTDKDGKISMPELTQITDMIRHFWKESDCESVISAVLMGLVQDVQSKRESNRVTVSSDVDRVGEQTLKDLAGLQEDVLRSAMADKVAKAVVKHGATVKTSLERLEKDGSQQEDEGDNKFGLDTATYGSVAEYHRGLDVIGAPHPNILGHMKMEAKNKSDSFVPFDAWNSGKNTTTAQKEWDFVCDPFISVSTDKRPSEWEERHDYGGNRSPIRLQVFMHAFSAIPMSKEMGASLFEKGKTFFGDYKKAPEFADTDPRWLHLEEVSSVQVVLMRLVKSQLDGVSLINALDKVKHLSSNYSVEQANIKAHHIVKALDKAFHEKTKKLHSKCTLSLAKALKKEITAKVARGLPNIDPVQARVLEHLHEVAQKQDSIDVQGLEDSKLDPDCTFDLLVDTFKGIVSEEEIAKKLDKVLHEKDGPHSTCTFPFLVSKLAGIATKEELEAIMHHFHTKIAMAKMLEAEVIGLREYSGPLYVKMNGSLRVVGAHVKMVIILSCALKKCTQDVKQTFKEVVDEVAQVESEVVSIDSVSELQTGTRIEFKVGVFPEKIKADAVRKSLTQSGINNNLAASNISNITIVEVIDQASVVALPDHLKDNRYVNTIFACASGMRKMAQVSRIPRGRFVFRGMGGVKLPSNFTIEKEGGGRGGVDYAFTSTTTKKEVAISYIPTDKKKPVLFKIETGDIDRGCSLSWVSQYPLEDETLIPAMSYLEITGNPTEEETPNGFRVTVYPARINCNTKSQTIEEIESRRKHDILCMMSYIAPELPRDLPPVVKVLSAALSDKQQMKSLYTKHLEDFESKRKEWDTADAQEFNTDSVYKERIDYVIEFKHKSIVELNNEADELNTENFVHVMSMEGRYDLAEAALSVGFTGDASLVRRDGATTLALAILLPDPSPAVITTHADKSNMLAILAGKSNMLNLMRTTKLNFDQGWCRSTYLRQLSQAFLQTSNIHRWLTDGWSPRGLIGVIGALLSSGAATNMTSSCGSSPSEEMDILRLSDVRAFLNRHSDLLQDISLLSPLTVSDVVEQLALQESDVFEGMCTKLTAGAATQSTVLLKRWVDWINKPQRQHGCRWTMHAGDAVYSVAYSADGSRLALAQSSSCDVVVCDAEVASKCIG